MNASENLYCYKNWLIQKNGSIRNCNFVSLNNWWKFVFPIGEKWIFKSLKFKLNFCLLILIGSLQSGEKSVKNAGLIALIIHYTVYMNIFIHIYNQLFCCAGGFFMVQKQLNPHKDNILNLMAGWINLDAYKNICIYVCTYIRYYMSNHPQFVLWDKTGFLPLL